VFGWNQYDACITFTRGRLSLLACSFWHCTFSNDRRPSAVGCARVTFTLVCTCSGNAQPSTCSTSTACGRPAACLPAHCHAPPLLCCRFERKKGIDLALKALHQLHQRKPGSTAVLVVAGGYDVRLAENREHLVELQQLAQQLGIQQQVLFVPSFTDR
jgi:hypothetical protein